MAYNKKYINTKPDADLGFKVNTAIRSQLLVVIDDAGDNLGEMSLQQALELANDKDLDLIEVSPKSTPPVARVMSWSKFKFEQQKKKKESTKKSSEMKEMWFKAFIGEADLKHKIKKVKEFIDKKNSVKLTIKVKGRIANNDYIKNLMDKILQDVSEFAEPQDRPKFLGRNVFVIVKPARKKTIKIEEPEAKAQIPSTKISNSTENNHGETQSEDPQGHQETL